MIGGEIDTRLENLQGGFELLRALSSSRAIHLKESLRSQEYYAEAAEAEQWLRERFPLAANKDTGSNQSAAEAHLRRLSELDQEVDKFSEQIRELKVSPT